MKFFYYFYAIVTAPGVVVHELSHAFFCVLSGIKIRRAKLFQFGKVAGFIVHDEASNLSQSMAITFGPLMINSLLAMFCFSQFTLAWNEARPWFFLWLGLVLALHAIPSTGDARSLFRTANHRFLRNPLIILAYPFVLVLYVLNILKRLHIDIAYAALLFWLGAMYLK